MMKEHIRSILEARGIKRSDDEYERLAKRWEYALSLRGDLNGAHINEANIVLRYQAGGEHHES